jgi:hypothetical protein
MNPTGNGRSIGSLASRGEMHGLSATVLLILGFFGVRNICGFQAQLQGGPFRTQGGNGLVQRWERETETSPKVIGQQLHAGQDFDRQDPVVQTRAQFPDAAVQGEREEFQISQLRVFDVGWLVRLIFCSFGVLGVLGVLCRRSKVLRSG